MADQRDSTTWVALELTKQGEKLVEEGTLADEIRLMLSVGEDWPVFVPAKVYEKRGNRVAVHLMVGYVFVATGLDEVEFFRLEGTKYVDKVMAQTSERGIRVLSAIPNERIREMRRQLSEELATDIIPGMSVVVTEGTYAKLEGMVEDIEEDDAMIYFNMRSLQCIAKIPKVFLDTV